MGHPLLEDKIEELRKELNNYTNIVLSCQGLFSLLVIWVLGGCYNCHYQPAVLTVSKLIPM